MVSLVNNCCTSYTLTGWPFCWADRDSLKLNTSPPTEHSRQQPHLPLPPQNWPFGCMISTPFVVSPSISTLSCHLVAFSCRLSHPIIFKHKTPFRLNIDLRPRICSDWSRIRPHRCGRFSTRCDRRECDRRIAISCSASLWCPFCRREACPSPQSQWATRTSGRPAE